jgi:ribosome-dependent ATPase
MLILGPAITFEIKSAKLCIIDNDMTSESRGLISKLDGSPFFSISQATSSEKEANDLLYGNKADVVLHIPSEFGRNLGLGNPAK